MSLEFKRNLWILAGICFFIGALIQGIELNNKIAFSLYMLVAVVDFINAYKVNKELSDRGN